MIYGTTRFGNLEIAEDEIVFFPEGLIGFSQNKKYFIIQHDGQSPFSWLQSLDESHLAYVIIEPQVFCYDYEIKVSREQLAPIDLQDLSLAKIYVVVVLSDRPEDITANLLGPIILNPENNLGLQVVLNTDKYFTRHRLMDELQRQGGK